MSSVRLHHGLDHLVAIGYLSGAIYMFQLPSMLIGHSKQVDISMHTLFILTLCMLGKNFSRRHFEILFFIFPRK